MKKNDELAVKETGCYQCKNLFPVESILHCSIDGNDENFCSENCIEEYSRLHPNSRITVLDAPEGHPLAPKSRKYFEIAEKIVEGLLEQGICMAVRPENWKESNDSKIIVDKNLTNSKLVEAVAEALKRNLTYGNLGTLTLRNNKGQIVAKLYILPDGTLADDSWVCNEGWKK